MTEANLFDAFATLVTAFAAQSSPPLTVAYPNISFTPPDSGQWLELQFFPNETRNAVMGDDGPSDHVGFFQLGCCERPGIGLSSVATLAGLVIAAFPKGTEFSVGRLDRKPWISSVLEDDARVMLPVTIPYRATV
jgi:hypothetical protein